MRNVSWIIPTSLELQVTTLFALMATKLVRVMAIQVSIEVIIKQSAPQSYVFKGGGFFVHSNNKWVLKGIVSMAFFTADGTCEFDKHSLYSTVSKFSSWYEDIVKRDADAGRINYNKRQSKVCRSAETFDRK